MTKNDLEQKIQACRPQLRTRFGVARLALFGSWARGEASSDSDIDLLVTFAEDPTFDRYMDLKLFLEDLLTRRVDLITTDGLRPELVHTVHSEAIDVA